MQTAPDLAHSASPTSRNWQGKLALHFKRVQDKTQMQVHEVQAPFKIQRHFYPEGAEICHGLILHTAGGIVGGDRLSLRLILAAETQALLTTVAATKVYGPGPNHTAATTKTTAQTAPLDQAPRAEQDIQIQVGPQAHLEWLPQESIIFAGANYQQRLRVELAADASWCSWEITRLGRTARGETFVQGQWRSHTEVWRQGVPLWLDPQWVPGNPEVWHSLHGLAGCPIVASFCWLGPEVEPEIVQQIRELWRQQTHSRADIGVTRLIAGVLCRYRGHSIAEVRQWFIAVWRLLRSHYRGQSVQMPRAWPVLQ
ncbi:MAG: urease accessory protein UreD [Cyanobacteria bacterium P01_H01_bin.121]